jgi:hypothetical protein
MNVEKAVHYIKHQAETYAQRVKAGKVDKVHIEGLLRMDAEVASECDDDMERLLLNTGLSTFEAAVGV